MAPEQSIDAKRADVRSDLYSLGAAWFHMVTGQVPFDGATNVEIMQKHVKEPVRSPQMLNSKVPRGVAVAIQRLLAKRPEDRFQTARELIAFIDEQCLGERDLTKELGLTPRGEEPLWDMKLNINGRLEQRRLSVSEVRERFRKG